MDLSNIDLDEVAAAVEARRASWLSDDVGVDALTWMDNEDVWPRPLLSDRQAVRRPMSFGVRLSRQDLAGAEVVVYAGGWADLALVDRTSEVVTAYAELDEPSDVEPLLDRMVEWLQRPR